jgi:hypothetical protein
VAQTTILGFHQDAAGDWVAELACGHRQHLRHRPPWEVRPWVTDPDARAARVGAPIACPLCDAEAAAVAPPPGPARESPR